MTISRVAIGSGWPFALLKSAEEIERMLEIDPFIARKARLFMASAQLVDID